MNKVFKLTDHEFKIKNDEYIVSGTFYVCRDNFGADIDGNRGVLTTYIDDYELKKLEVNGIDYSDDMLETKKEAMLDYLEDHKEEFLK